MAHHIDVEESPGEILRKLKDEEIKKREGKENSIPGGQETSQGAKGILNPGLCNAIKDKDFQLFISTLATLCGKELCVSEIMDQTTRSGNTLLHLAVHADCREILEPIADHFPKLLTVGNFKGHTVLHVAALTKKSNLIKTILECSERNSLSDREGGLCRMEDKYGNTALHYAVMNRDCKGVSRLFETDYEAVHKLNKEGKSPLYLAIESRELTIIRRLLKAPLENVVWHPGNSPLHAAILGTNNSDYEDLVCEAVTGTCVPTMNPLQKGRRESNAELVRLICVQRAELIRTRDSKGDNPLHWAASIGDPGCVARILQRDNLSTLEWNVKGHLPVHVACKRGHVGVVKKFVEQKWLDQRDLMTHKGQNILHIAAKNGKDKVVNYILSHKKQLGEFLLNDRDQNGNTPLHLASKYLHPKVLFLLTKEIKVDVNLVNNKGLTARDIVLLQREVPTTFRELLVSSILYSAGATMSEKGRRTMKLLNTQPPQMEWLKDRINTLMLVAILVATVTYAAGFTMPGGYNSADNPDSNIRGMASLVDRKMFQVYTICDVIAMYSSTIGSFILLWAQLGDFHVAFSAMYVALYLVGLALITMSIAFMAAFNLVVSNLSWLANFVMILAILFLSVFFTVFVLLIFPFGARNRFLRQISYLVFKIVIPFSGSDRKFISSKKMKKEMEKQLEREKGIKKGVDTPSQQDPRKEEIAQGTNLSANTGDNGAKTDAGHVQKQERDDLPPTPDVNGQEITGTGLLREDNSYISRVSPQSSGETKDINEVSGERAERRKGDLFPDDAEPERYPF